MMRFINSETGEVRWFCDNRWCRLTERWIALDHAVALRELSLESMDDGFGGKVLNSFCTVVIDYVKSPTHMDGDPLVRVMLCGDWRTLLPWETL